MSLFENLQVLNLLKDGAIKSYSAFDPQSGTTLLLHWLPMTHGSDLEMTLLLLDKLPPAGRDLIIETGIRDKRMYLITEHPPGFRGLQEWLNEVSPPPPVSTIQKLEVPPSQSGPGEFTRLFIPKDELAKAVAAQKAEELLKAKRDLTKPVPRAPEPPPAAPQQPGEFTQMFRAASIVPPPTGSHPAVTSQPPAASSFPQGPIAAPASEPGEFTRMFKASSMTTQPAGTPSMGTQPAGTPSMGTQPAPPPRSPSAGPGSSPVNPAPAGPGEFTMMFKNPGVSGSPASSNPVRTAPPSSPLAPAAPIQSRPDQPGEFTKFFQSPLAAQTPAIPSDDYFSKPSSVPVSGAGDSEFTQIFGRSDAPAIPPPPMVPPPKPEATGIFSAPSVPSPMPTAKPAGPSEYTQMFAASPEPIKPQPVAAPVTRPAPAPVAKKQSSPVVLILVLAVLAVLALVLVFFFLHRR